MKNQLEEGQIVLCEVTKIVGTTVFVRVEEYNLEGTISFPEIAPGRIRNIRDYAFPGKRIVCKVLTLKPNSVELSLRRVKVNEKSDFNEANKREKSAMAMLKTILAEKSEETIGKIKESEGSLIDFLESSKEKPIMLEKYFTKEQATKLSSILGEKKIKETILSRRFSLSTKSAKGIVIVKEMIKEASKTPGTEASYVSAGKYLVKLKTKDLKQGDQALDRFMESLESQAKKKDAIFLEEKK